MAADCVAETADSPDYVVIEKGQSPLEAYLDALGCPVKLWRGKPIEVTSQGESTIRDILVDAKGTPRELLLQSSEFIYSVPVGPSAAADVLFSDASAFKLQYDTRNLQVLSEEDLKRWEAFPDADSPLRGLYSFEKYAGSPDGSELVADVFGAGISPFSQRMIAVNFLSEPIGANIEIEGTIIGSTGMASWVAEGKIERVVLSSPGFDSCTFDEGSYHDNTARGTVSLFYCALKQPPATPIEGATQ